MSCACTSRSCVARRKNRAGQQWPPPAMTRISQAFRRCTRRLAASVACHDSGIFSRVSQDHEYFPNLFVGQHAATVLAIATEEHGMGDVAVLTGILSSSATPSKHDVLVLGLGNTLLGDDGVGVHVVRRLARNPDAPPGLRALDGGTLGFRLMAALTRSACGHHRRCGAARRTSRQRPSAGSKRTRRPCQPRRAHERPRSGAGGPADAWRGSMAGRRCGWRFWVSSRSPSIGATQLSEPVERSVPRACQAVMRTVLAWQEAA